MQASGVHTAKSTTAVTVCSPAALGVTGTSKRATYSVNSSASSLPSGAAGAWTPSGAVTAMVIGKSWLTW